jgi:hypothetical protein
LLEGQVLVIRRCGTPLAPIHRPQVGQTVVFEGVPLPRGFERAGRALSTGRLGVPRRTHRAEQNLEPPPAEWRSMSTGPSGARSRNGHRLT